MFQSVQKISGDVISALPVTELSRRPFREPDYAAENRALLGLVQQMAFAPEGMLQKLAETALAMCRAQSAGLSLLEENDQKRNFHWRAIAGRWASHVGGGTPRDFGPCGTVLDRNVALLFSHPERDFPYFGEVEPTVEEALLIPFYVGSEALGTIWIVAHDQTCRFDAEDLRVMTNLGTFAGAAYQALQSLNASQQLSSIVESSDDAVISKDLNGVVTTWNGAAQRLFGYTAEEIIGKSITILIPAERHDEEPEILDRIRRGERIGHYETVRRRKDGTSVDISLTVSPIRTSQGKIIGASKIARDITEGKRNEGLITMLAREAEHRARNMLASVQAIVHLTKSDTPENLKQAIEGRIQALANVHGLFVASRWMGAELRSLVLQEVSPYCQDDEMRVVVDGPNILLEPSAAQTVAVSLHELATNAAKYGALSTGTGRIRVEWLRKMDGRLRLRWTERDGPLVKPPTRRGFGTRVMENMIRDQLKGEMCFAWKPGGLVCEITLPMKDR